jgi:hypothetical protein
MNNQEYGMDESQFAGIVAIYGGEIQHFPEESQAAARQLLAHSHTARQIQQTALKLDNLLDTVKIPPPSPLLRQRILRATRAATSPDIWQRLWQWAIGSTPTEYLWRPAVTFLLPLLLGVTIGFYSVQNINNDIHAQTLASPNLQTTSIEQEIDLLGLSSDEFLGWE